VSGTSRHNLRVVLLADGSEAVAERSDELRAAHVAAPARVAALEWLATDEDDARQQAHVRVLAAALNPPLRPRATSAGRTWQMKGSAVRIRASAPHRKREVPA
jgi:hypothetical protein